MRAAAERYEDGILRAALNGGPGKKDVCNGGPGRDSKRAKGCETLKRIP